MSGPHWKIHRSPGRWQATPITKTGWTHLILWLTAYVGFTGMFCFWAANQSNVGKIGIGVAVFSIATLFAILGLVYVIRRNL
jgi:hypothetical protein